MASAAATYFVMGKADDENFAKAESLAETLMSALPSGDVNSRRLLCKSVSLEGGKHRTTLVRMSV